MLLYKDFPLHTMRRSTSAKPAQSYAAAVASQDITTRYARAQAEKVIDDYYEYFGS